MMFKIIDRKTGKEPTERVIHNIAKKGGLMEMDIDGFYVGEDVQRMPRYDSQEDEGGEG